MPTRALIALVSSEKYEAIYCHSDGGMDWTGKLLRNNYNSKTKARELVALGDLYLLGETPVIDPSYSLELKSTERHYTYPFNYYTGYDDDTESIVYNSLDELMSAAEGVDYIHIYDTEWVTYTWKAGKWKNLSY